MVGTFTADLEFLSKFLGHQGASARYLCMFCKIVKAQCKEVFEDPNKPAKVDKRTIEMITANAKTYKSMMSKLTASLHVILGITTWLVRIIRKAFRRLERLEANAAGAGVAPEQFQERVEESVRMCDEYEKYLLDELSSTVNGVAAEQKVVDDICHRIAYYQQIANDTGNPLDKQTLTGYIKTLNGQLEIAIKAKQKYTETQVDNECQAMESLFITRKMKEEHLTILKKHEGHASRVISNVMGDHGVDENVYHKRSIDGNHCLNFGKNGQKIIADVAEEMRKVIKDKKNLEYLDEPTFLKSHLLFDFHLQEFLETWETLGGFDEQSIESTHPQFNQLLRRYGSTRGEMQKRQVMRQFLMERASFVIALLDEMIQSTSKPKRPNTKKRGSCKPVVSDANAHEDQNLGAGLSDLELKINANDLLHPRLEKYPFLDTRVSACTHCAKRLINFGAGIHYHEYHSCSISDDVDSTILGRLKEEGAV